MRSPDSILDWVKGVRSLVGSAAAGPKSSVGIIGGGAGGICAAIQLLESGMADVTIFEKNDGFGGTWRDNSYPGSGCDVPSNLYSFSFEQNPTWSRRFARQDEILDYFERLAAAHGLHELTHFGTEVASCRYLDDTGRWVVTDTAGTSHEFDYVISALGQLNQPAVPDFEGADDFSGTAFHSARWDHDADLDGKDIVVVGAGASAIQFVPEIAPGARHLTLFQRTPNWVAPKADRRHSERELELFRRYPAVQRAYRYRIFLSLESRFFLFRRRSRVAQYLWKAGQERLRQEIGDALDPDVVVPEHRPCQRICRLTPGARLASRGR